MSIGDGFPGVAAVRYRQIPHDIVLAMTGNYRLKESLFIGPLDIVGDVHGEIDALCALMSELGYSETGEHADGRRLIFVGDLVDRGPDSPAVLRLVKALVETSRAKCVLGNHELNLLLGKPRPGNSWWFDPGSAAAESMTPVNAADRDQFTQFLLELPLVLEGKALRIVHACWDTQRIDDMVFSHFYTTVPTVHDYYNERLRSQIEKQETSALWIQERLQYGHLLTDPDWFPRYLPAIAKADTLSQMGNAVRVLTSGSEGPTNRPFWAAGKWRMVERKKWWDDYQDDKPVIIGHYWRRWDKDLLALQDKRNPDLFADVGPRDWMGKRANVFCVDYSVGARFNQRIHGHHTNSARLAAVRVPEWDVMFDDGQSFELGAPKLTWQT